MKKARQECGAPAGPMEPNPVKEEGTVFDTIAPPRLGTTTVNAELDQIIDVTETLTTSELANDIAQDGILGHPYTDTTPSASPVGRWVLAQLQAVGIDAAAYMWGHDLTILDTNRIVIGQVHIPQGHTLVELDTEVNDLERPELCWQGEGDPR